MLTSPGNSHSRVTFHGTLYKIQREAQQDTLLGCSFFHRPISVPGRGGSVILSGTGVFRFFFFEDLANKLK